MEYLLIMIKNYPKKNVKGIHVQETFFKHNIKHVSKSKSSFFKTSASYSKQSRPRNMENHTRSWHWLQTCVLAASRSCLERSPESFLCSEFADTQEWSGKVKVEIFELKFGISSLALFFFFVFQSILSRIHLNWIGASELFTFFFIWDCEHSQYLEIGLFFCLFYLKTNLE